MTDKQRRQDLIRHNQVGHMNMQVAAIANLSPDNEDITEIGLKIQKLSDATYRALSGALRLGKGSDDEEAERIIAETDSRLRDIISEEGLPLSHVYIEDICQGDAYVLGQNWYINFDTTVSTTNALQISAGSVVRFTAFPATEVKVQLENGAVLTLQREFFPTAGLLVETREES